MNITPRHTQSLPLIAALLMLLCPVEWNAFGQENRPQITVVATGGTIAGQSETRTSFQSYQAGRLLISDMVEALRPEIDDVAAVTTVQFGNRGSGG